MNLQLDFYSDWVAVLRSLLVTMGYVVPAQADPARIPLLYLNALKRRIRRGPRTILTSREFVCPGPHQAGLANLETKVRNGDDLKPHLSKFLKNLSFDDALLNDWNVYHLHLGLALEADGYIQRTGPVLFALVTSNELYKINVFPHQQWSNTDVVEIIHNNWPHLIQQYRVPVAGPLGQVASSVDVAALRKGKVNTFIQTNDGTVYTPIGGGYSNDGTSTEVVIIANKCKQQIRQLEKHVRKGGGRIVNELKKEGYRESDALKATLQQNGNRWKATFSGFNYVEDFGELKLT